MGYSISLSPSGILSSEVQILVRMKVLLATLALAALVNQGSTAGIHCYTCSTRDVSPPNPFLPYDPNCGSADYSDPAFDNNWIMSDCCHITVHGDTVIRDGAIWGHSDGECIVDGSKVSCFCTTDNCNTGLCEHCTQQHRIKCEHCFLFGT